MAVTEPALAVAEHAAAVCPNCGTKFLDDYCHKCGEQKHHAEELTLRHFVLHATHDLTHVDTKIFATLRYLFTRPGFLTQEFIAGRRLRYMRPFSLFLVAVAVYFLIGMKPLLSYDVQQLTAGDKTGQVNAGWERLAKEKNVSKEIIMERVNETLHHATTAAQILNALAMALVLALFFRKRYFMEHMVFSLHFFTFSFFLLPLLSLLEPHISARKFFLLSVVIFVTYLFLSVRRVYGQGRVITLLKSVAAYTSMLLLVFATYVLVLTVAALRATIAK